MKRQNAGKDEISRKSAKPSRPTTKPKASKAPKAQTECMTVWRHAGRRSASRVQGQPNVQSHTFDWDSQANSTSLAPEIARLNTSQEDGFGSGRESIHSDYFTLGPEHGQHSSSFHRMPRDARSPSAVSRGSRSNMSSPMMLDGMRDARSPLPYVTPPLQRPRRITLHGSSLSSHVYDRQHHELSHYSNPWVPHDRSVLKRRRCITLHGDSALPISSNDFSQRSQPFHDIPNDSNDPNMLAPGSLSAGSIPSISAFSPGSVYYSASETSLQSPPTLLFPSIPQTSLVDVCDNTSSPSRSYSSHGPSPITEMSQYSGSLTSPNLDNPWGVPAGSLSALSSPSNPSLLNPSYTATGQLIQGAQHSTGYDQYLHGPRNPYSRGVNQVNYFSSPQGAPPFSSSSSYTSENYEPYQLPLNYNPIPQTASSDLHYSPGLQNALQLEFSAPTLNLSENVDVSESETDPLDSELLLMNFYMPQSNEYRFPSD
ncbi:hypothetical protein IW261DRAFT_94517 [Armillaria novae-zelandiae]|uniref:Uncharacterized protein n=1 Tax=Armillaria novae-zelandiae TaxID=153914 RepID=A0AA39PYL9_9AGAR|nr:hypothetical protein IW261DRAFT_94517 [Armillaria novae-zelandiae]